MSYSKRLEEMRQRHSDDDESFRLTEDVYTQPEYGDEEYFSYDRGEGEEDA